MSKFTYSNAGSQKNFRGKTPGPPAAASNAAGKGAYNAGEGKGKGGGEGGGRGVRKGGKDCVMALGGMDAPAYTSCRFLSTAFMF